MICWGGNRSRCLERTTLVEKRSRRDESHSAVRAFADRVAIELQPDALKRDSALCAEVERVYYQVVVGIYDYQTDAELEAIKSYWRKRLPRVDVRFSCIGAAGARSAYSIGIPKALVPTDSRMGIPDLTYANAPCHRPLIRMIIQHDGEVCHCCEDTGGFFNLGNVHESSIKALWFSQHHQHIVADLLQGARDKHPLCRNCPMGPTAPAPAGEKIAIARRRYAGPDDSITSGGEILTGEALPIVNRVIVP